jgi:hypothetical protein
VGTLEILYNFISLSRMIQPILMLLLLPLVLNLSMQEEAAAVAAVNV